MRGRGKPVSNVIPLRKRTEVPNSLGDLGLLALRAVDDASERALLVETLGRHAQVRGLAARLARSLAGHGPEDLVQATLERVVRGLASYRGSGDLLGWVGRIMRNTHIELLRREAREQSGDAAYRLEPIEVSADDPTVALDEREIRASVLAAWRRTSSDADVRMFWDRAYVGLSVEQLMRRTGRPRSTVYLMLQRGGQKLAREVGRLLEGGPIE
jgi:RNA polymerase sigma factor (sigma-70 family)